MQPSPRADFFFQEEDGIRDYKVTGVQTCALPIYRQWRLAHLSRIDANLGSRIRQEPLCCAVVRAGLQRAALRREAAAVGSRRGGARLKKAKTAVVRHIEKSCNGRFLGFWGQADEGTAP